MKSKDEIKAKIEEIRYFEKDYLKKYEETKIPGLKEASERQTIRIEALNWVLDSNKYVS